MVDYTVESNKNVQISGNTLKTGLGDEHRLVCTDDGIIKTVITDGTNLLFDAAARAGFVKVTDGTNTMPTMDIAARRGFVGIVHGTGREPFIGEWNSVEPATSENPLLVQSVTLAYDGSQARMVGLDDATNRNLNVRIRSTNVEVTVLPGAAWNPLAVRLTDGVNLPVCLASSNDNLSNLLDSLVVTAENYGMDPADSKWDQLRAQSAYANIDDTLGILSVGAVVHGEDLDVGAGNSEPVKIRADPADDSGFPENEKHLIVHALLHVKSGDVWVPMTQP